jgi:membrane protease subunit HflK
VLGPGLALSWPWPLGSAHVVDVTSVRHLPLPDGDGEHLLLTRDGGLVDLAYDVRWRIRDLRRHDLGLADPDALLERAADTAMRASVAGSDFSAIMGAGRAGLGRRAAQRLQALLNRDQAGIVIDGVDIRRLDPPARFADTLRAVTAARNDAATEATQAQSWSRQLIVHAQGEAGAFDKVYAQYRQSPDVTRRQMYYATMERVLSQSDKVIVDAPGTVTALPPLPGPDAPGGSTRAGGAGNGR